MFDAVTRRAKPAHVERPRVVVVMRLHLLGAAALARLPNEMTVPERVAHSVVRTTLLRIALVPATQRSALQVRIAARPPTGHLAALLRVTAIPRPIIGANLLRIAATDDSTALLEGEGLVALTRPNTSPTLRAVSAGAAWGATDRHS